MKLVNVLPFAFLLCALPVGAEISPKIHKLCLEAKDYAGCVKAMTGAPDSSSPQRLINQQGADIVDGNQCPNGFAYIGGGNCQDVKCEYNESGYNALGHDSTVAGKKDLEGRDVWGCKRSIWTGAGVLRLSGGIVRVTNNSQCPPGEPDLGYNSTCQTRRQLFK
jgi:hypothetical protein